MTHFSLVAIRKLASLMLETDFEAIDVQYPRAQSIARGRVGTIDKHGIVVWEWLLEVVKGSSAVWSKLIVEKIGE
ncbi:hypothetical protein ACP3V5_03260 [Vibrio maritimus]